MSILLLAPACFQWFFQIQHFKSLRNSSRFLQLNVHGTGHYAPSKTCVDRAPPSKMKCDFQGSRQVMLCSDEEQGGVLVLPLQPTWVIRNGRRPQACFPQPEREEGSHQGIFCALPGCYVSVCKHSSLGRHGVNERECCKPIFVTSSEQANQLERRDFHRPENAVNQSLSPRQSRQNQLERRDFNRPRVRSTNRAKTYFLSLVRVFMGVSRVALARVAHHR
jgi:hypothetical protein